MTETLVVRYSMTSISIQMHCPLDFYDLLIYYSQILPPQEAHSVISTPTTAFNYYEVIKRSNIVTQNVPLRRKGSINDVYCANT